MASAVALAPELQRRVIAFNCGDERYAGEWLLDFRRKEHAWLVCAEALQTGLPTCCDEELLQEFCAQTLAHLARSFKARLPETALKPARDGLESLLAMHAEGPKSTWKQLALALTCACLWLGSCAVNTVLHVTSLPLAVRSELLLLPTELLFSDRALPLDDIRLRQAACMALFTASQAVLPFLLRSSFSSGEEGKALQVIASWLRAVRKSLKLLAGCDEAVPLRILADHGDNLLNAAALYPAEASEIAQQLALWPGCDEELAVVLGPLLDCLFVASPLSLLPTHEILLPLLQDLAGNCWPRAALGDLDLDWQGISNQAVNALHSVLEDSDADSTDVEAALGVWQTFAATLCKGQADAEQPLGQSIDGIFEPRRKRMRRRDNSAASRDRIVQSEMLPQIFAHLIEQLLRCFRTPAMATQEELLKIWDLRRSAQSTIAAWAMLLGGAHAQAKAAQSHMAAQKWSELAWSPLHNLCQNLQSLGSEMQAQASEEMWPDAEVVLWFSAALASSWPEQADEVPVKHVLPRLQAIDAAPYPWQPLLWCSACGLATRVPVEHCQEVLLWMLDRSPATAVKPAEHPVSDVVELTGLRYADHLEFVSRQLPSVNVHVAIGDRLAAMALATFQQGIAHEESAKAQSLMLLALRRAMSSNMQLLCKGLNENVLPSLCDSVAAEVADAPTGKDSPYIALQTLFSTLVCTLPDGLSTDLQHPTLTLWQDSWKYIQAAMVSWPESAATDQPVKAAVQALIAAVRALPAMLPEVLQLFSQSLRMRPLPDMQLDGLREIAMSVPCPPVDPGRAAELLSMAIREASQQMLCKQQDWLESPTTSTAFFRLAAEAMGTSTKGNEPNDGEGLCAGKLRASLLEMRDFVQICLDVAAKILVDHAPDSVVIEIMRFCAGMLSQGRTDCPHRPLVVAVLPQLCHVMCLALDKECLLDLEILEGLAEVLTLGAVGYGSDFSAAFAHVLDDLHVPAFNGSRLQRHVDACAAWGHQRTEWLEQLQQIVREWQCERRHATC